MDRFHGDHPHSTVSKPLALVPKTVVQDSMHQFTCLLPCCAVSILAFLAQGSCSSMHTRKTLGHEQPPTSIGKSTMRLHTRIDETRDIDVVVGVMVWLGLPNWAGIYRAYLVNIEQTNTQR